MNNNENNLNYENNSETNKKIEKEKNHEATKKAVKIVGGGLSYSKGGETGKQTFDNVADSYLGDKALDVASKVVQKNPTTAMNVKHFRDADEEGALDFIQNAVDTYTNKNPGNNFSNPSVKKSMLKGFNGNDSTNFNNLRNNFNQPRQLVTPYTPESIQEPEYADESEMLDSDLYEQQLMQEARQNELDKQAHQEELLRQEEIDKKKKEKKKENAKKIGELIKKDPKIVVIILAVGLIGMLVFLLLVFIASDMDLVGTNMKGYEDAQYVSGYCSQIILIKEHDDFSGNPVSSIDDVDLSETFTLNKRTLNRWSTTTYDLETYVKGVVEAEAKEVNNTLTFEVASIAARTYALQIANNKCHVWDNTNKRTEYRNPQNFNSSFSNSEVASAVSKTNGIIITIENKLLDMSNGNYYDYFCNEGKVMDQEDGTFYQMLQRNEEERLIIPTDWVKENNILNLPNQGEYSGKYDGQCQKEGMSLFGAKYLLNKKVDPYTTIRILKYYYGYDIVLKRVGTYISSMGGCYYWPTTGTRITSEFGLRTAPTEGASTNHGAIDIAVPIGSDVYATAAGTVTFAGAASGYGYAVYIDHGNGIESRYAHLKADGLKVSTGQTVSQGQVIALSGNTGVSTGPHLHFEIRINGVKVDPLNYVSTTNLKPDCSTIIAGGSAVNVGDSAKSICLSLKNYGFSNAAIAGIMTNMAHESGFSSINLQNSYEGVYNDVTYTQAIDSGTYKNFVNDEYGYGLVQWTSSGRKQGLYNYAVQTGSSIGDLKMQIDYFVYELQASYGALTSLLRSSNDASSLATQFCLDFERPKNLHTVCPNRGASGNVSQYLNFANNNCQ